MLFLTAYETMAWWKRHFVQIDWIPSNHQHSAIIWVVFDRFLNQFDGQNRSKKLRCFLI